MAKFNAQRRRDLAAQGKAMKDGSFPTPTLSDLDNAIKDFYRGGASSALKSYLTRRAQALGASADMRQRIANLKVK